MCVCVCVFCACGGLSPVEFMQCQCVDIDVRCSGVRVPPSLFVCVCVVDIR
jgi:hypothetical protein